MPETRHGNSTTEWEAIRATDYDRGVRRGRHLVYWNRVVRGADGRGHTERLSVTRARGKEAGPWVWHHRGPDANEHGIAVVHAMSGSYGTTAAAKRAADRYFRQLLADEAAERERWKQAGIEARKLLPKGRR